MYEKIRTHKDFGQMLKLLRKPFYQQLKPTSDTPRSVILRTWSMVSRRFPGLMSLCMMPLEWRQSRPAISCVKQQCACHSRNTFVSAESSIDCRLQQQYSNTMYVSCVKETMVKQETQRPQNLLCLKERPVIL